MSEATVDKVTENGGLDRPLARHLAVVLVIKLILLFLLWFLFFRVPDGAREPGFDIQNHIAGSPGKVVSTQKEADP
jgi:hypothetical protein